MFVNTKPVVFPCKTENVASKWLKFRVNKLDSLTDADDEIEMFVGTGIMCSENAAFDDTSLKRMKSICKLNKDQRSCPGENIRVSDTVSDPSIAELCVVAYCGNEYFKCEADIEVEFYDQFAKPSELSTVVLGLTGLDLFVFFCNFLMTLSTCGVLWGLFGKYIPMWKDKRDKKRGKKKAALAKMGGPSITTMMGAGAAPPMAGVKGVRKRGW